MRRLEQGQPNWREREEQKAIEEFQDRHRSFADKVERLLLQLVILGLVALVLVQGLQLNRFTRVVAYEGIPVHEVVAWSRPAGGEEAVPVNAPASPLRVKVMAVTRRNLPGAKLLVDGQVMGDFRNGWVSVDVRHGQTLSIDGRSYGEPLTFRVVEVSGVASPVLGTSVTTRGDQQRLGVVRAGGR